MGCGTEHYCWLKIEGALHWIGAVKKSRLRFFAFLPKVGGQITLISISTPECQMFLCHDKLNAYHMILDNF